MIDVDLIRDIIQLSKHDLGFKMCSSGCFLEVFCWQHTALCTNSFIENAGRCSVEMNRNMILDASFRIYSIQPSNKLCLSCAAETFHALARHLQPHALARRKCRWLMCAMNNMTLPSRMHDDKIQSQICLSTFHINWSTNEAIADVQCGLLTKQHILKFHIYHICICIRYWRAYNIPSLLFLSSVDSWTI